MDKVKMIPITEKQRKQIFHMAAFHRATIDRQLRDGQHSGAQKEEKIDEVRTLEELQEKFKE